MKKVILLVAFLYSFNLYGQTGWIQQTTNTSVRLKTVNFLDANYGFAAGQNGRILKTTNGGTNWVIITSGINADIEDIRVLSQ